MTDPQKALAEALVTFKAQFPAREFSDDDEALCYLAALALGAAERGVVAATAQALIWQEGR